MRKVLYYLLICVVFLFYSNINKSQTVQNDNNYNQISNLFVKGRFFEKQNFDSVFFYYNKALYTLLNIQKEHSSNFNIYAIAYNYYLLANASINNGNNSLAIDYYEKGKQLLKSIPFNQNRYIEALYFKLYAIIEVETENNLQNALISINKAMFIFKNQNNAQQLADCYLTIGRINLLKKMPLLAIQNFKSALALDNGSNIDIRIKSNCLNYLGETYNSLNIYDSSLFYYTKSNLISLKENDTIGLIKNYLQFASLYSLRYTADRKSKILNCYKEALKLAQKSKSIGNEINVLNSLAFFYFDYHDYNTSIVLSKKALSLVKQNQLGSIYLKKIAFNIFNDYYSKEDYYNAIKWYQQYFHFTLDNINEQNNKILTETEIKYETKEKEHQLQLKSIEIKDKTKKIKTITFGIILLALIIVVLVYIYIHIKKKNRILVSQNKEINAIVQAQNDFLTDYLNTHKEQIKHNILPRASIDENKKNDYLNKMLRLLNKEKIYSDKELTIEKLAEAVGTNRTYLSQIISDYAHTNYNTFINNYRINEARLFLADPKNQHCPIKSIYDVFGFNSDKYFCEVFKKQTGFSPFVFRKKMLS